MLEPRPAVDGFETDVPANAEPPAVTYLLRAAETGRPWAPALVEAIGMWTAPRERVDGRDLTYLVAGEAFDWLLLAERLLRAVPDAVPPEERERLLFGGELPSGVSHEQFKDALGPEKYRAYLNFFYGVVVEEALWLATERDVSKRLGVRGRQDGAGVEDLVMRRLYGAEMAPLVRRFNRERGCARSVRLTLAEWTEFTYWLFKLRVGRSDSARTASDTRRGLGVLRELRGDGAAPLV